MPKSVMEEESEWRFPEDTPFPARLMKVEERTVQYTRKTGPNAGQQDSFTKWEWDFLITAGEFEGLHIYGDTDPKISTHPDNQVRPWSEALLDTTYQVGMPLDTDVLLGIDCYVTAKHTTRPGKDGGTVRRCPVNEVFNLKSMGAAPAGASPSGGGADPWAVGGSEPPF